MNSFNLFDDFHKLTCYQFELQLQVYTKLILRQQYLYQQLDVCLSGWQGIMWKIYHMQLYKLIDQPGETHVLKMNAFVHYIASLA